MNIRVQNKERRQLQIIKAAEKLFIEKGLYDVQMQEIADVAGVGIATLFRYFAKRELIIVAVACQVMEQFEKAFENISNKPLSAFDKIEELLRYFLTFAHGENYQLIRFRDCFESYASFRAEPLENIEQYFDVQKSMINHLMTIIEQGKVDGSINSSIDIKSSLFTYINCFGKFTAKLAIHEDFAEVPEGITTSIQQQLIMELFLKTIKP